MVISLPTNIDATYPDGTDPSQKLHQEYHDTIHAVVNGAPWITADFVLFKDGSTYYARSGTTGQLTYSGAEPGAVLQSCITNLGLTGGTIVLAGRGDFAWGSVPTVPVGITGKLKIASLGHLKVVLSTSGPRFVDLASPSVGDTFQNIELDGITVDATAIQANTDGHHILFGNYRGLSGMYSQINYKNLIIRNCKILNGRTASGGGQTPIYIACSHSAASQAMNTIENVLVENIEITGFLTGVSIVGVKSGAWSGDPNIWIDKITVRNIKHNIGSSSTGFLTSSHVHVGSRAQVGTVTVDEVYGYGSRDVGVEVNGFQEARVSNIVMEEYNGYSVFVTNHQPVRRLRDQTFIGRNISGRHLAANAAVRSGSCSVVGVVMLNSQPLGNIEIDGVKYYRDVASLTDAAPYGSAVIVNGEVRSLSLQNVDSHFESVNHTDTTNAPSPSMVYIRGQVSTMAVNLRNIKCRISGTAGVGATTISLNCVELVGLLSIEVHDVRVGLDITSAANFGLRGMGIGAIAGSNIKGTVRGFKVLSAASVQPRGIVVASTSTLTIPTELRVEDSDFSQMPSPSIDVSVGASQEALVRFVSNKWRAPIAPRALTVAASPYVYRNLDSYTEQVSVRLGTVSEVAYSRDGSTYTVLNTTTGVIATVHPGDYLRVTYSATPTMNVIPDK